MASRWCWVEVSWFVLAALSSATGECPEGNLVRAAVKDMILPGQGFASVQYPIGTTLKLSCVWPTRGSCLPRTQRASMTLDDITRSPPPPSCVTVVNKATSACEEWYESSITYVVKSGSASMVCSFDGCTTSNLHLTISSGQTRQSEDSKYHLAQSNANCPKPPTGSTSTTKTPVTTSTHSTTASQSTTTTAGAATIPGLNPLIYTLLAVTLLGTASVVAMISCWMRHRRIMQRRREALFGTEYLDFMGEQDFTTVTTNQLLASLGEAPPTYQQSEVIEQRLRQAEDGDEETPPPLPPRNTSTQDHHQLEPEPPQQPTGAGETDVVGGGGEGDKEEGPIESTTTDSEEEEETHSAKDGDSTALIR